MPCLLGGVLGYGRDAAAHESLFTEWRSISALTAPSQIGEPTSFGIMPFISLYMPLMLPDGLFLFTPPAGHFASFSLFTIMRHYLSWLTLSALRVSDATGSILSFWWRLRLIYTPGCIIYFMIFMPIRPRSWCNENITKGLGAEKISHGRRHTRRSRHTLLWWASLQLLWPLRDGSSLLAGCDGDL